MPNHRLRDSYFQPQSQNNGNEQMIHQHTRDHRSSQSQGTNMDLETHVQPRDQQILRCLGGTSNPALHSARLDKNTHLRLVPPFTFSMQDRVHLFQ